jgi:hypothetical protein
MKSPYCLCACVSLHHLKTGILEPEETAIARQHLTKHVPAATNIHSTRGKIMDVVFSVRLVSYQIFREQKKESRRLILHRTSCYIAFPSASRSPIDIFSTVFYLNVLFLNSALSCHQSN